MHGFVLSRTTEGGRKEYLRQHPPGEPRQFVLDRKRATVYRNREEAEGVAELFINSRWTVESIEEIPVDIKPQTIAEIANELGAED